MIPPCTRSSLVYENVCSRCNKGAASKKELEDVDPSIPSIYVGETSRTIRERAAEHWRAAKGSQEAKKGSHMVKHQEEYHNGEEPQFIMRVVDYHKSALQRQAGEAVRIQRRGGAGSVLNSRGEFNRCYIPRLRVVEEEVTKELELVEEQENRVVQEFLEEQDNMWESSKTGRRKADAREQHDQHQNQRSSSKRAGNTAGRRSKRMKFAMLEEDWGLVKTTNILEEVTNLDGGLKDGHTDHQLQGATMVGAELTNHPVETGELRPPQLTGGESNQDGQGATNPTTTNPSRVVRSVNHCSKE